MRNYWNAQLDAAEGALHRRDAESRRSRRLGAQPRGLVDGQLRRRCRRGRPRALPNQKIVLVGHAMGATVALEAARTLGARVIGIIAVDSLKTIGQPPHAEGAVR